MLTITANHVAITSLSILLATCGCLARIGLIELSTYNNAPFPASLYSNVLGCFVASLIPTILGSYFSTLAATIVIAFSGSLTTFSAWMVETSSLLGNYSNTEHYSGRNVLSGLAFFFSYPAITFASLILGYQLGMVLTKATPLKKWHNKYNSKDDTFKFSRTAASILSIFSLLVIVMFLLLVILYKANRHITLSALLSPVGAFFRYGLLVLFNNYYSPTAPLEGSKKHAVTWRAIGKRAFQYKGTLYANLIATVIAALCYIFMYKINSRISPTACWSLYGISNGLAGTLSTFSTFAKEVYLIIPPSYVEIVEVKRDSQHIRPDGVVVNDVDEDMRSTVGSAAADFVVSGDSGMKVSYDSMCQDGSTIDRLSIDIENSHGANCSNHILIKRILLLEDWLISEGSFASYTYFLTSVISGLLISFLTAGTYDWASSTSLSPEMCSIY